MSTEFFIDDVNIKSPLNISGFYLIRELSGRTNGNLYEKAGRVEGVDSMIIDDPDGIEIITSLEDTFLTEARATFEAKRYGRRLFSAEIDFNSIPRSREGVIQVSLKDYDSNIFIQNIDKVFSIPTKEERVFSSETVYLDSGLELDEEKLKIEMSNTPANLFISPAFGSVTNSNLLGSLLESNDFSGRPFYKNSTGQRMKLNLGIELIGSVTVSDDTDFDLIIIIKDTNGNPVYDLEIESTSISAGTSSFFITENYSFDIPVDANVSVGFKLSGAQSKIDIEIFNTSRILISEGDLNNIKIPVISVNDAMLFLVNFASDGLLQLVPYDGLAHLYLSPYAAVRGRDSHINISFGELWDDLSSLFCLKLSKEGSKVIAESFVDSFEGSSPFVVSSIKDYTIQSHTAGLYNSIKAGFSNWKPKNDSGIPEKTAPITVETNLKSAPSELDLSVKKLIGSLKLLSETYLMRNRPGTENENESDDDKIFLLSAEPSLPISSIDSFLSWSQIIGGYHGILHKSIGSGAGEGAYMNEDYFLDLRLKPSIFTGKEMILSCDIDTEDFISMGDFIRVVDIDKEFNVFVDQIKHYPVGEVEGEGNAIIIGRILK